MNKLLVIIFISQIATIKDLSSQELPDIITDRPYVTESSFTVPKKSIQIESGFSYTKNEYTGDVYFNDSLVKSSFTDEYIVTPSILARYGLSNKIELRLGAQLTTTNSSNSYPQTESYNKTNLEGVVIALKFKLADQKKILPSTALILGSTIPALNPGQQTDIFDPAFIFAFSNRITENFGVGYNIGVNLSDGFNSSASGSYTFNINYSFLNSAGVFVEAFGYIPFSSTQAANYLDAGFTFLTSKNIQLDLSGGYGLNSDFTEYFLSTGISFRLPK